MQKVMRKYRIFCLVLTIMLITMGIPIEYVHGEVAVPVPMSYTSSLNGTDDIRDLNKTDLDVNGSIYIKFSSDIREDISSRSIPLLDKIRLYSIPENTRNSVTVSDLTSFLLNYNYNEKRYLVSFSREKLEIENVEFISENTIKIKPKSLPKLSNQYQLEISKEFIEDGKGNNLTNDVISMFWTKRSLDKQTPHWDVTQTGAKSIQEDTQASSKTYNLINTPRYGLIKDTTLEEGTYSYKVKNVSLYIENDIIPRVASQQFDISSGKIIEGALNEITIEDVYEPGREMFLDSISISSYIENNKRISAIHLLPVYTDPNDIFTHLVRDQLEPGKLYRIHIPAGVFETRSGIPLEALTLNLYTEPDPNQPKSISYLENNKFKVTDLHNNEGTFSIRGVNFHHNIKKLTLEPFSGKASKTFTIQPNDFELKDLTKIDVHIRNSVRNDLKMESNTGTYAVNITFDDTPLTVTDKVYETVVSSVYATYKGTDRDDKIFLHIETKGKPTGKTEHPKSENGKPWYDEKSLKHDVVDDVTKDKYFMKVTFDDLDGQLGLTTDISDINNCIIRPVGGMGNLVDTEFIDEILHMDNQVQNAHIGKYIFVKSGQQATLYIPVKPLRAQTNYQVIIPSGIVHYKDTSEENESFEWTFTTTAMPLVKELSVGTIPEDYDEDEPLYIHGDFFSTDSGKIKVYFDDIEAESVTVVSESELKVYLPDGSDRLEPGTYNIIVQNDSNHKRTVYGSLGVVKAGDEEDIPNEEYKVKGDGRDGEVRGSLKVSEDTLLISPSDINERELEFNLDELMGEDVLVRKIQYEGDKRYTIDILKTKSKWADIILYGLTLDPYAQDDEINIRLGRVESSVMQMLKTKLRSKGVVSDFIQVSGENYKIKNVMLNIPLKYSNGKNIKVLRYDENTRNFYETRFTVNLVDKKVEMVCPYKGIYVVVTE